MNKIVLAAVVLAITTVSAQAGQVNQFEIAKQNQQYHQNQQEEYYPPPPPPPYYHKKHHNNDNDAWIAGVGGFIGGFLLGSMNNGYDGPPVYVPPAYVVPGQAVEQCGTVWTMEPDGFGGWQRTPHTVCGY